jgi:hypothetical protein
VGINVPLTSMLYAVGLARREARKPCCRAHAVALMASVSTAVIRNAR